ncbi:MAG: ABC transporter ATP-binding protein [Acidobacteria bacterium]|nr:ABC transporter ATP-binding protein [Acidobacteriota bacterium]MBK8811623.1 ABC transporter ATP-binding protein [Acidobacteriota bacterium]
MNKIIEIQDLTKDYELGFWKKRKVRALDGLNLEVSPGQIFGFLGGNGAGKTTTIKLLMSLIFPTRGNARILGHDISDTAMHSRIGYCPENPYFYDYLTARELMNYFGEIFGFDAAKRRRKTEELLTKVGLDEKDWDKQLRKFSKGMLQRVGLAQCLINEPEIVFLDEPMSGLDPIGRREIRELIAGLRNAGTTVFMSTHILSDIEALCDNVAILRRGKLAATGNLSDLLTSSGENQTFEIVVKGVPAEEFQSRTNSISGSLCSLKANGASIQVLSESDIPKVLSILGETGGNLVSVQPVRQSLEELFVKETVETTTAD